MWIGPMMSRTGGELWPLGVGHINVLGGNHW